MPSELYSHVLAVVVVFVVAVAFVWTVDWFTHGHLRRLFGNSRKVEA